MTLQEFLMQKFTQWSPPEPEVMNRTKYSITLDWSQVEPFEFIADQLLYRVEKNDKIPPWFVVYRGGKTKKEIDNLAPRHPHKFRIKVIVKAEAVPTLANRAVQFYGDEDAVYERMTRVRVQEDEEQKTSNDGFTTNIGDATSVPIIITRVKTEEVQEINEEGDTTKTTSRPSSASKLPKHKWIESQWSDETWTNTDTDGTSIICFCMAVRCGYIKQVQGMLDERPELIGLVNPTNGFTPLATAVRKGDINVVRFLISAGAEIDQPSATGQTPLHIAVLTARLPIADLLMEKGADFKQT